MSPAVSVLLPVKNGERHIGSAVQSILDQTLTDFELVVVDDGCTDGTVAVVRGFRDDRIRLVEGPGRGPASASNEGLRHCRAPLIARLDHDDIAAPDRLFQQKIAFDANPALVLVGGGMQIVTDDSEPVYDLTVVVGTHAVDAELDRGRNPFLQPSVMFRREAALEAGGYDEALDGVGGEDAEFWPRLRLLGEMDNLPHILGCYRLTRGAISNQIALLPRRVVARRARVLATLAAGPTSTEDQRLLEVFRRRCARVPNEAGYQYRIGKAYLDHTQRYGKAARCFAKAWMLCPLSLRLPWNLAKALTLAIRHR